MKSELYEVDAFLGIEQEFDEFCTSFQLFANKWTSLMEEYRTHNMMEAETFNIFRILKIAHYEVTTHSPILRELLDSQGSHGQGNVFFIEFLNLLTSRRMVSQQDVISLSEHNYINYSCEAEQSTEEGRLDIIIRRLSKKAPFCFIIENKIYAQDQQGQIARYWSQLDRYDIPVQRKRIFYLTLYGSRPSPTSISEEARRALENAGTLCYLSYKKDVREWLQKSLIKVESDKVSHILKQYLEILEAL